MALLCGRRVLLRLSDLGRILVRRRRASDDRGDGCTMTVHGWGARLDIDHVGLLGRRGVQGLCGPRERQDRQCCDGQDGDCC